MEVILYCFFFQISFLAGKAKMETLMSHFNLNPDPTPDQPSIFGPGLRTVPGGPSYLNRTVMSWHYYCPLLGTGYPDQDQPYDPGLEKACHRVLGPDNFDNVRLRAKELGGMKKSTYLILKLLSCYVYICFPNINLENLENLKFQLNIAIYVNLYRKQCKII